MRYVYIDGYDLTSDVDSIPAIDINIPEFSVVDNKIMNDTNTLTLPQDYTSFFKNGRDINKITVQIYEDSKLVFDGFVDTIEYRLRSVVVTTKSKTTILFNSTLDADYVIVDAYPSNILKQLCGLLDITFNTFSYNTTLNYHKALDITFDVIDVDLNYAELFQKLAEVTCGKIYFLNNEIYYEIFSNGLEYPVVELNGKDFVSYPVIEQKSTIGTVYNGTDVKYGAGLILYNLTNATKVIDMSNSSIIRTSNIITAQHIAQSYDSLGSTKKYRLNAVVKESLKNILYDFHRIYFDNRVYSIVNLNHESNNDISILAESVEEI